MEVILIWGCLFSSGHSLWQVDKDEPLQPLSQKCYLSMSIRANHLGPMKVDEIKMAFKSCYTTRRKMCGFRKSRGSQAGLPNLEAWGSKLWILKSYCFGFSRQKLQHWKTNTQPLVTAPQLLGVGTKLSRALTVMETLSLCNLDSYV